MPYVGKTPLSGNYQVLDPLTASATDTYALTKASVAVFPQTPANCIVSLNGVIQAPFDSYTISGSNIVFASALTASDSIDFITVLGDVLNVGTVSDGTIGLAKLSATGTKDSTTFLRGDNTFASAGGTMTPAFRVKGSGGQVLSDATTTKVIYDTVTFDTNSAFDTSNYRFVVPSGHAGKYNFYSRFRYGGTNCSEISLYFYKNGGVVSNQYYYSGSLGINLYSSLNYYTYVMTYSGILSVGDYIEIFAYFNNSSTGAHSIQTHNETGEFVGYKIIE